MMTQDAFVQLIVEKVMKRLGKEPWFLMGSESNELEELVKKLGENQVYWTETPEQADWICVTKVSARTLAEIARGYGDSEETKLLIEAIAEGKKVCFLEEGLHYRKYRETCPAKLYEKWQSNEAVLLSYGVRFTTAGQLFGDMAKVGEKTCGGEVRSLSENGESTAKNSEGTTELRAKLITENLLSRLPQKGSKDIQINEDAIVTPLAQDYIRQERLNILRVSERS